MPDDWEARALRKSEVFYIMYGTFLGASDKEMAEWRTACAKYINGTGPRPPLTLQGWRDRQ